MRYDKAQTQGRWPSILKNIGVDDKTLSKNNVECPFCGGKDRFRFTDHEGAGVWICNQCGTGNGIQFVERWENCDFKAAVAKVRSVMPQSHVAPVAPVADPRSKLNALWSAAHPIEPCDPVSEYLAARGIEIPDTKELRTHEACPYYEDGKKVGAYPAMLARVCAPDGTPKTLHVTYVHDGKKAPVKTQRKVLSKMGEGPSVRLFAPRDGVLHVAEGIETALSVRQTNRPGKLPACVWSLLSAGAMQQFTPPPEVHTLWVWADHDVSFTGQCAAYHLAHRLHLKNVAVKVMMPSIKGTDWADVFTA